MRRLPAASGFAIITAIVIGAGAAAQGPAVITLPPPVTEGGKPLMQVLKERRSTREFAPQPLSQQVLSNLLWAAWGVNRPDGRRTAPSAMNKQEIDIYVTNADGAYLWNAKTNQLTLVAAGDLRAATGGQPFVATAAANLVYVADMEKAGRPATDPQQLLHVSADAGFIAQNVYLFCASEGLATVVRAGIPKEALAKALKLRESQVILLAQTVGYPVKK